MTGGNISTDVFQTHAGRRGDRTHDSRSSGRRSKTWIRGTTVLVTRNAARRHVSGTPKPNMNFKTITFLAALSGSSVAAFASSNHDAGYEINAYSVHSRHSHHHHRHDDRILRYAPPPLRHEYRGHRPHRHAVWIDGYWTHRHGHHVWMPGHWARIPHGRHAWVHPRWERRHGGYIHIDGYWR